MADRTSPMEYGNIGSYRNELGRIRAEIESGQRCTRPGEERVEVEVAKDVLETYVGEYAVSAQFRLIVTWRTAACSLSPRDRRTCRCSPNRRRSSS